MTIDEASTRAVLQQAKRIVIKVGTRVLVNNQGKPDRRRIQRLVDDISALKKQGKEIILVSSGAIAAGLQALKITKRPHHLPDLQMAASVGQTRLLTVYHELFNTHKIHISQVLLTHDDLKNRTRHLNARHTLLKLMQNQVLPIVNENDVVSVDEIKFGDNDVLSSLVATLVNADCLLLLTSANGLQRPDDHGVLKRVPMLEKMTPEIWTWIQPSKAASLSTGGMESKLKAAHIALKNGVDVVIASSQKQAVCQQILAGKDIGTFMPTNRLQSKTKSRKRWIAFFHKPQGQLIIDKGAQSALCERGKSLLAAGIKQVNGPFVKGALVEIVGHRGERCAQGLVDYNSAEIDKIKGQQSKAIREILGNQDYAEVVHRDNLWIFNEDEN